MELVTCIRVLLHDVDGVNSPPPEPNNRNSPNIRAGSDDVNAWSEEQITNDYPASLQSTLF
jgi:hypothetical protein